jgi:hypothetical protein
MFKEIKGSPGSWQEGSDPVEPDNSYLVVGEFARRFAEAKNEWKLDGLTESTPHGRFVARVTGALPISVSIVGIDPNVKASVEDSQPDID